MPATYTAAITALDTVLASVVGATVYDHTPVQTSSGPIVSIDWDNASSTSTQWITPVNVFLPAAIPSVTDAQRNGRLLIDRLEAAFDNAGIEAYWRTSRIDTATGQVLVVSWVVTQFMDPL